jgi:hypothetical protein
MLQSSRYMPLHSSVGESYILSSVVGREAGKRDDAR